MVELFKWLELSPDDVKTILLFMSIFIVIPLYVCFWD